MTSEPKWPKGPYHFLEADDHEHEISADVPLTIYCEETLSDLANIFSCDDSTVETTREQAIAVSHLFAAAPDLYDALAYAYKIIGPDAIVSSALSKARGEK